MGKMKDKQLHDLAEKIGEKVTLELDPALDRILDDLPYSETPWALSTILHVVMHRVWETCPDGMYATSMIVGTHDEVLSHYLQKSNTKYSNTKLYNSIEKHFFSLLLTNT